jgi:hypothetical protein
MKISCLFNKHKYGKMQFEEDGSPYKICEGCGKRQNYALRSLSELDNMQMWEVEELMGGIPVAEEVLKMAIPEPNVCKVCGGDLVDVEPAVVLDGLVLMECQKCGERCYK